MIATGVGFAFVHAFWPLIVVAFVGTLNPSSGDVSIFLPLEQSLLPQTVSDARAHRALRALQPGRVAGRGGAARSAPACRPSSPRHTSLGLERGRSKGCSCSTRLPRVRRPPLYRASRRQSSRATQAPASAAARVEADGLHARGALQPRLLRRRLRRPVAAGALALPAVPSLGGDGGDDLLLDGRALGRVVPGRRAARAAGSAWSTRWSSRICRPTSS